MKRSAVGQAASPLQFVVVIVFVLLLRFSLSNAYYPASNRSAASDSSLKRLFYDDHYMTRFLERKYPYLRKLDEQDNQTTIGYVGIRDYFDLRKVFWPDGKYLASKNLEQYLYEELKGFDVTLGIRFAHDHWHYSDATELAQSGGKYANKTKCELELFYLHEEIAKAEQDENYLYAPGRRRMDLLRWIDAWGRPPSETNWGNTLWAGSYRACKLSRVPIEEVDDEVNQLETDIEFNYCWAKLRAKDWPREDVLSPPVTLRSGMCLPRSCDTLMAREHKELLKQLIKFNFAPTQRERFLNKSIEDVYCLPLKLADVSKGARWPLSASLFLWATAVWLGLVALASVWYCFEGQHHRRHSSNTASKQQQQQQQQVLPPSPTIFDCLECFALQRNWAEFMADCKPKEQDKQLLDLRVLSIIKLFACLLVAFSHCFEYTYWYYHSSTIHLLESRRLHYYSMTWMMKSNDAFIITSGILIAFSLVSKFPKNKLKLIVTPRIYVLLQLVRYLRLAPVLFYVLTFAKLFFVHLGEGPFWDYGTYELSQQSLCRQIAWWRQLIWPIIFDAGALGGDPYQSECMPGSWYIVTDMKMFLVLPAYFLFLQRNKFLRLHILGATALVSSLWCYLQMNLQNLIYFRHFLEYGLMHSVSIMVGHYETGFYSPVSRFYALAFGLFAGLHLFRYKQGKIKQWPFYMRGVAISAICLWQAYDLTLRSVMDELKFRETRQVPSDQRIQLTILLRQIIDSIAFCILALRLTTDWSRAIMKNANILHTLSKLSYCVYIIHIPLIQYVLSATQFSRPDSEPLQLATSSAFIILTSFAIALPLHLLLESPLALLLNNALANCATKPGERDCCDSQLKTDGKMVTSRGGSPASEENAKTK